MLAPAHSSLTPHLAKAGLLPGLTTLYVGTIAPHADEDEGDACTCSTQQEDVSESWCGVQALRAARLGPRFHDGPGQVLSV